MDIITVLGITWHKASAQDVLLFLGVLSIPVGLIAIIKIIQKMKYKRIHNTQLFLFRLKRMGLSNFQIKIINSLVEILGFSNPNLLFEKTEFFEGAIGRFLAHARATDESEDSQRLICRDITVIYDKLYYHTRFKKPLKGIQDVDEEQLIYFSPVAGKVFLGKITSRDGKNLFLKIFGSPGDLADAPVKKPVTFHLFRVGDAVYEFTAPITGRDGASIHIAIPDVVERREETRHPYIDVIIPAQISKIEHLLKEKEIAELEQALEGEKGKQVPVEDGAGSAHEEESEEKIPCTIYKINDYEAILRFSQKLDFNYPYYLEFTAMDFNFKIKSQIIATKTVDEGGAVYYTVKFEDMSPGASHILNKYVYEHL